MNTLTQITLATVLGAALFMGIAYGWERELALECEWARANAAQGYDWCP